MGERLMELRPPSLDRRVRRERTALLHRIDAWLDGPLVVLAFVWLGLFVWEMIWGVSPLLEALGYAIWVLFILDFLIGFLVAPEKGPYLRANVLKLVGLLLPAVRALRVVGLIRAARLAGAARGLRLARVLATVNRSMGAFGRTMRRRGLGYVVGTTVIVTFAGAAGMLAFEQSTVAGRGLPNFGAALWWTAMIMTTMGSDYWPQTAEGRVLCFLLSVYAFTVFGYVTAALASYFIGRDAEGEKDVTSDIRKELSKLREELRASRNADE
jgi:voltage-gated potassium channel